MERLKGILKIRPLQLQLMRTLAQRKQLNERYRHQGPKCLEERGTSQNNSILPDIDQMTEYWTGVIGVLGTHDLEDPAIKQWQEGLRKLPTPTWEEPKPAVWRSALKKIRNWKAPGRPPEGPQKKRPPYVLVKDLLPHYRTSVENHKEGS